MFWKYWTKKKWTNRKIAFVAILVATSVAFVLILTSIIPIASLPSLKLMAGGLPIKLTGYIFGPFIGAITGVIVDLLSFAMRPTYYHYWYTIAFAFAGFIPGVVGYFMNRRWKDKDVVDKKFSEHVSTSNYLTAIICLTTIFVGIAFFVLHQDESFFESQKLITSRFAFLIIATSGTVSMLLAILFLSIFLKPRKIKIFGKTRTLSIKISTFNSLMPIIVFSAILEMVDTPIIALGDMATLTDGKSFLTILTGHFLLSPIKIWGNLLVLLFSYKIIAPLIYNKTNNGWKDKGDI